MRIVLNILKWVAIALVILVALVALLLFLLSKRPFVPTNYTSQVETGGEIEAKYLAKGSHKVARLEADAPEDWGKFIIYYPADLEEDSAAYPAVIFVNGTGVYASKYPALFEHLASWGFIVAGNEDPGTYLGDSADGTLAYLLARNEDPDSVFYQNVDPERIGISGHSQGGVGVINAITITEHKDLYKAAVALSPTNQPTALALEWPYDPTLIQASTLLLSGAGGGDDWVVTLEGLEEIYDQIPGDKVMVRRANTDHGATLYSADGYVTAWFLWHLQGDQEAAKAFVGEDAELMTNPLYQDQQSCLGQM